MASPDVGADFTTLHRELALYREELARRERVIVLNKIDLLDAGALAEKRAFFRDKGETVIAVSAAFGLGIDVLKDLIRERRGDRRDG